MVLGRSLGWSIDGPLDDPLDGSLEGRSTAASATSRGRTLGRTLRRSLGRACGQSFWTLSLRGPSAGPRRCYLLTLSRRRSRGRSLGRSFGLSLEQSLGRPLGRSFRHFLWTVPWAVPGAVPLRRFLPWTVPRRSLCDSRFDGGSSTAPWTVTRLPAPRQRPLCDVSWTGLDGLVSGPQNRRCRGPPGELFKGP
ncbi:hypothetical protein M885DRAFT_532551 [Pelagophyceae sp. CCMP2097]|nr:hypothetical protein M885DRAFT_532551 [Pelagophyceae sp. CCMP2097]